MENKENQLRNAFCRYFSNLMYFVMPHTVIKFELMMFCELIYHFVKTQLSFAYKQWLWVIVSRILLEIFTDSLCSKSPPQSLDILWYKVLFFKTWISVVLVYCFWKKLKTIHSQFFSHFWSLKCCTFLGMTCAGQSKNWCNSRKKHCLSCSNGSRF